MNVPMTTTLCKRFPQPETVNHTKDLSPFVVADAPFEKSPGFLVSLGMTRRGGAFSLKSEVGIVLESLFTSLAWILHFVQDDESGRGFQGNRIRPSPPKPESGHHSERQRGIQPMVLIIVSIFHIEEGIPPPTRGNRMKFVQIPIEFLVNKINRKIRSVAFN